jgi:hypothetical protein
MQLQHQMQMRVVGEHIVLKTVLVLLRDMTHVWETYIVFPGWKIGMQILLSLS